ncbi:hypothetical protein C0993_004042, partial [Termitomyces sp. T159_Od127]
AAKPATPHVRIDIPHPITVSGLDDSELSPLSPTSSPFERRNVQEFPRLSPEPTPIASSSQIKKAPTSPRKRAQKSSSLDTWDSSKLGTRVWVLIDYRARVLEPDDLRETKSQKDWIWWPAKVLLNLFALLVTSLTASNTNRAGYLPEAHRETLTGCSSKSFRLRCQNHRDF